MNVLVTGATGFLGRYVVWALLGAGHRVRAMVRAGRDVSAMSWPDKVDVYRADLTMDADLCPAFDDIDALIHLATPIVGDAAERDRVAIDGTRRLLDAMAASRARRVVHASSFSVYDWHRVGDELTEDATLLDGPSEDAYAVTKLHQEQVMRDMATEHDLALTVLRPGMIWGPGRMDMFFVGGSKPVWFIIAPRATIRHTYVENCADVFVKALDDKAVGKTFNVVDGTAVTAAEYANEYARLLGRGPLRIPIPYAFGHAAASCLSAINARWNDKLPLPSILRVRQYEARFKPVHCPIDRLQETLNWSPPWSFEQAMDRVFTDTGEQPRIEAEAPA